MIIQNAYDQHDQIKSLIKKSMINMTPTQVDAWMKYQFDPENMFCFWQDGKITSCLQMKRRLLKYKGQKLAISCIAFGCTLPDYRQRTHFTKLLEAALEQSTNNDIMTLVLTSFPKLFENRSFTKISKTKYYWISSHKCKKGKEANIQLYHEQEDLYPLYKEFISHFDGSIQLTKEQFDKRLQYELARKNKVALMYNASHELRGFAIYKGAVNHAKVTTLIYLDTQAIDDLFNYLSFRFNAISFVSSNDERFEKLFPYDFPRTQDTFLGRLNNYKLFSKWSDQDIRNIQQAFDEIEGPMWNHFF